MTRPFLAAIVIALFSVTSAIAQEATREPGRLILDVTGEAVATPDLASVRVGVRAEGETAASAMAAQREAMTAVVAALGEAGVAETDIQTSGLSLYPVYGSRDRSEDGPRITGYEAANQVTAIVRDLTEVGPTLDALVTAGANDIQGITFGVEDQDSLADAARRDAVAKMRARAALYADAADLQLGRLVELRESGGAYQPPPMARARADFGMESTPIAGGELTVSVTLTGVYEIES